MPTLKVLQQFVLHVSLIVLLVSANTMASDDVDVQLEAHLDQLLGPGMYPADRKGFAELLMDMTPAVPVSTYVRAWGYRALELAHAEQSYTAAEEISRRLIAHAQRFSSPNALAEAYALKAEVYGVQDKRHEAARAIGEFQRHADGITNPRIQFFGHNVAGRILMAAQQHEQALAHFLQAQEAIAAETGQQNVRRRQFLTMHIARLYATTENFEAADQIIRSTIEEGLRYDVHHRFPDLYLVQGYVLGRISTRESAIHSYRQAIHWANELADIRIQIIGRNNIASEMIRQGDYDGAEILLQEGRAIAVEHEMLRELQFIEFNLADIAVKRGHHQDGIERMLAIREVIVAHGNARDEIEVLFYLAEAYGEIGAYQKQAETLLELHEVRQRVFRSDREQLMAEMQARYEAQDQAQQIELLQQENLLREQQLQNTRLLRAIMFLVAVVLAFIIVAIALGYRASKRKNEQLNEANRRLHQQALQDPLTRLGNRRHFQKVMQKRSAAGVAPDAALFILDLDNFKQINDTLGHAAGDEVLREVARRLRVVCGDQAEIIRWGGEEFLILVSGQQRDQLIELTQNLLLSLNQEPVMYDDENILISGTIGMITLPFAGVDEARLNWEKALQLADNLLYIGKLQGRDQAHCLFDLRADYADYEGALFREFQTVYDQGVLDVIKVSVKVS
ncbi:MAG: GGDEF domain-containing protein [Aliidiomarina sp.]|uniref:tetratricopeptide repeat-containing diguanylate cyclase n=1 Tax=Aliidiomarina sp. TaxID=1872439 RepID=UPI0025BA4E4D|nr:GGDEF domain-containing protein [Aliidiomarina sp.]MCH8500917.1 GGDEF domain-containing protein [Aliidiomarina sp.]